MFYQTFFSPQLKRCAIITYKHGIYELSHELPNDLNIMKVSKLHRMIAQSSCQNENLVKSSKKFLKNRNQTFPVGRCFT